MKILAFSDLHTNYKNLKNIEALAIADPEILGLVCAGDILNMGNPVGFMMDFIETINKTKKSFLWVPGNNDFGPAYHRLYAKYPSLEGRVVNLDSLIPNTNPVIRFTGVGGSPASWAGQYAGEKMIDQKSIGGSIFVSHVPPPGLLTLQKHDLNSPTSSKKFADSPIIHICGHEHWQWGCAYLGMTKIVKIAAAESGYYATIELDTLSVEFGRF